MQAISEKARSEFDKFSGKSGESLRRDDSVWEPVLTLIDPTTGEAYPDYDTGVQLSLMSDEEDHASPPKKAKRKAAVLGTCTDDGRSKDKSKSTTNHPRASSSKDTYPGFPGPATKFKPGDPCFIVTSITYRELVALGCGGLPKVRSCAYLNPLKP